MSSYNKNAFKDFTDEDLIAEYDEKLAEIEDAKLTIAVNEDELSVMQQEFIKRGISGYK